MKREAPPKHLDQYELFSLDPDEKTIVHTLMNKKRSLVNPKDPYFSKYGEPFTKKTQELYDTQKVLKFISPRNHTDMKDYTKE